MAVSKEKLSISVWSVFTDGSHISNSMKGSWAFSIHSNELSENKILAFSAGAFFSSLEAELAAIYHSVRYIREVLEQKKKEGLLVEDRINMIEVKSDCRGAIDRVNLALMGKLLDQHEDRYTHKLRSMISKKCNMAVVVSYTPGHTGGSHPDNIRNEEVDRACKYAIQTLDF